MSKLSICHDPIHYSRAVSAYEGNSNVREVDMDWWRNTMPGVITKAASSGPFRVLAVGAGNGQPFDEELLNILCAAQKHIVYTVVEPSPTALKEFKDFVKNKYSSVEFKWFCATFQDFQDKEVVSDGYNLIHFLHSVYYISSSEVELRERLRRCYKELLHTGGAMVITAHSYKGKSCLPPMEGLWWIAKCNKILQFATDEGWKVEADEGKYKVDASLCFDETSEEGNFLLDFVTRTKNYRQVATKEQIEKTLRYIQEQTDCESKVVYPCIIDLTTIWKESVSQQ